MADLPIQFLVRRGPASEEESSRIVWSPQLPGLFVTGKDNENVKHELVLSLVDYAELIGEFGLEGNVRLPGINLYDVQTWLRTTAHRVSTTARSTTVEQALHIA